VVELPELHNADQDDENERKRELDDALARLLPATRHQRNRRALIPPISSVMLKTDDARRASDGDEARRRSGP
jgi:hypothetical protein